MDKEPSQTEIRDFITSSGLDVLDERGEALEAWRQECNLLIEGFLNYLEGRFSAIEHRLERLEQLVEERYGYQKDGI